MNGLVKVASTRDLLAGRMLLVEIDNQRILLANVGGQLYAVDEACTHSECPLSEGSLDGAVVECPCHGSRFDVTTGEVVAPPANDALNVYTVRVVGDNILGGLGTTG